MTQCSVRQRTLRGLDCPASCAPPYRLAMKSHGDLRRCAFAACQWSCRMRRIHAKALPALTALLLTACGESNSGSEPVVVNPTRGSSGTPVCDIPVHRIRCATVGGRAMQSAGLTVTASAPMSGPHAMAAFVDAVFSGRVSSGGQTAQGFDVQFDASESGVCRHHARDNHWHCGRDARDSPAASAETE